MVAAQFTGTTILDGNGKPIGLNKYIFIPEGVIIYKGNELSDVAKKLKVASFSN